MVTFIKDYDLNNIRKKFIILYLLNVSDIIFTLSLLRTGLFKEINIFMAGAVQSPVMSIILKIFFPAVLLYLVYNKIKDSDEDELRAANIGLLISLSVYSLVNLSHIVWVALLPVLRGSI